MQTLITAIGKTILLGLDLLSIIKKGMNQMIIKIERKEKPKKSKKSKKPRKQRKTPTIKVGTHKKLTFVLWVLLIGSVGFGIYKNFTAIGTHTIHINQVESFVESFAKDYFSWKQSQEEIDKRNEKLPHYLTEELQTLNAEMIRKDIPTSSSVNDIQVWQVSQINENDFEVLFSVEHVITEDKKTRKLYLLAFMWLSM